MGGLGKAVSHAVISGRRETTKSMRKTPSIGHDIEGWEVHEVQIPGTQIEPQRAIFGHPTLVPPVQRVWYKGEYQSEDFNARISKRR